MFVISKKDTDYLKKGQKYKIIKTFNLEYQIEHMPNHYMYIGKDDTSNFEYYL